MSEHLITRQEVERFLAGKTSRAENASVVHSLLINSEASRPAVAPDRDEAALTTALDRALAGLPDLEAHVQAGRPEADRLAAEIDRRLASEPNDAVLGSVDAETRFHSWPLSEALRSRSFDTGLDDPERAVALARVSVRVAELAARSETPVSPLDQDALTGAWAQLGNALRIASELHEAESALLRARSHRDAGTGDPLTHAQLLSMEASLARDRSRFREGIALCRKAARLYRRIGDLHGQGRMLIHEAGLHVDACDVETAIACLSRAAQRVDGASEPRLALVGLHNLTSYLDQQGRYDEAWERLEEARRLARRLGHRLDLVRLRWLEGRIAAHRGDDGHAEVCWNEARGAFIELTVPFDAALVSLEMTDLLARQGRRSEIVRLVEEMVPIFRSQSLHREAQAALKLFSDAIGAEPPVIAGLAREVGDYLEKSRYRPLLPFRS